MRKLLFITLALVGNLLFSNEEDVFKDKKKVIRHLKSYMAKVDGKDLSGMYKHLSMPFVLHFDSDDAINVKSKEEFIEIFNGWNTSTKGKFHSTKFESIEVEEVFANFLCVADVTYARLDKNGETVRKERALYHFIKGERFSPFLFFFKWWKTWKIYMISNVELKNA